MQRVLTTVTLLGLLVATAAAFVVTEHLKLMKSPIAAVSVTKMFSPVCRCATNEAAIGIKLRHPDRLSLAIEDSSGHTVATIASSVQAPKGFSTYFWNGRTDAHIVVANGIYQAQVALTSARRTILLPNRIQVDTIAPKVLSANEGRDILVPGATHTVAVRYSLSEPAHPVVYLRGRVVVLGRRTRTRSVIKWNGLHRGSPLPDGRYVLELGAIDLAGNRTPPAARKPFVVVLRTIVLGESRIDVRAGASFEIPVRTSAPGYTWRFAGKHGTAAATATKLRLRAPSTPGRYHLLVSTHGHSAGAFVIVSKK